MEIITLVMLIVIGISLLKSHEQRQRIALLGSRLGNYQIEKLMESLTEGYLRCLGESDRERRAQIWILLDQTEQKLSAQFGGFASDFARLDEVEARVSRLPLGVPYAVRLLPAIAFDMRRVFAVHARGIATVMRNDAQRSARDKAFMMSAELFLMQHSCHWFCRSKMVASARMMARHQTSYQQLVDAVSPETRSAYLALVAR